MIFFKTFLKRSLSALLNILCPPICPICKEPVETPHCLCAKCYRQLKFITKPCCQICGRPFEYAGLDTCICGSCMKQKPKFNIARSILEYDDFSKKLVLAFKHGDHTELSPLFVKFLCQADHDIFKNIDIIIPVPLHWTRRLKRKYNQAGLLGRGLSHQVKIPFHPTILKRSHRTESQGHKKRSQRIKNIKNAFTVKDPNAVIGKHILLIDDVMTTGATLNECAKVLRKAGAKTVNALTIYRVLN